MTKVLYPKFKEGLLSGAHNLVTATIKAVLVDTADYTYGAGHQYLSDIPAGAREETSAALTGKSVTGGVFDADDTEFTNASGDPCEAIVLFKDTGDPATSPLILYTDEGTGLPVILNGGTLPLVWDSGASKIFAL